MHGHGYVSTDTSGYTASVNVATSLDVTTALEKVQVQCDSCTLVRECTANPNLNVCSSSHLHSLQLQPFPSTIYYHQ